MLQEVKNLKFHLLKSVDRLLYAILALIFLGGCLPVEKVAYLQDDQIAIEDLPTDQVVNQYTVEKEEYQLRAGDVVSFDVISLTPEKYDIWDDGENIDDNNPLLSGYVLDDEGKIKLPLVGKVAIAGMTLEQAESTLEKALEGYIREPTVALKLLSFQFTVLGEVKSPGRYTNYNERLNLLEALGYAGDMTDFGDRTRVQVVRSIDDQVTISYVNLLEEGFLSSPYFYVEPNDMLVVLPTNLKNFKRYQLANIGILLSTVTALTILLIRL